VKTINVSDDEAGRFLSGGVATTSDVLPEEFFAKIERVIRAAAVQMHAYCAEVDARRVVYIIVNFDDRLGEYSERYRVQIDKFLVNNQPPGVEIELDIKPAFYAAQT
jgi:hypothetical protein